MKVAAALYTLRQHSQPDACSQSQALSEILADGGNLRAWRTYLSDDCNLGEASISFRAQTMRVAATLHIIRQDS